MFNLKQHSTNGENDGISLLESELSAFGIHATRSGRFNMQIGDDMVKVKSLDEGLSLIQEAAYELTTHIWERWNQLRDIADLISHNNSRNDGGLENLLFLANAKKSFLLSSLFSDLDEIRSSLRSLFNQDISEISDHLISQFNKQYLLIKLLHRMIMRELYRIKLIVRFKTLHKSAQISGPWANLDLPMKERVWEWDDDAEYFDLRQKARQEQVRYNPEFTRDGFFYIWQDLTRDPYLFTDRKTESPYKSRSIMAIP